MEIRHLNSPIFQLQKEGNNEITGGLAFEIQLLGKSFHLVNLHDKLATPIDFLMRLIRTKFFLFFSFIALVSCDPVQNKLDSTASEIEYAQINLSEMSEEDWTKLELSMAELEQDLEMNRNDYSAEQIKEAGKIQGTYAALVMKKGLNDLQESVQDFGNQMEGFIEGINSDTTNN
jgi:hypothetical protein